MRLLLTTDTVGGVWTFTYELTRELLMRGHEVLLLSFGQAPSRSQVADAAHLLTFGHFEYVASQIALEWQPDNRSAYTSGRLLLLDEAERFRPDASLLSQFCFGALQSSAPKIIIAHSDVLSWADAVGVAPLADDEWLQTYIGLVQAGLDRADLVVAPTAAMLSGLQSNFGFDTAARVIANGRTLAQPSESPKRQVRAVTAGRLWDPAKNLALLLATDLPLPVVVAGEIHNELERTGMLTWTGQLEAADLHALFRESAMYVCCSCYEPFGLAALEAALCGCAVLAYDIPSLREVWGEGALYFHDAATLSALLHRLSSDSDFLSAAQMRSIERTQHYGSSAMAEGYLQAINSLLCSQSEVVRAA